MGSRDQGADATEQRWMVIPRTLCFVTHGDDVLLMRRAATRRIFPNRYNGLGGHIERDETPLEGAIREIYEESGLRVEHIAFCGTHMVDTGGQNGIMLFTFRARATSRACVSDEREGTLHWISRKDVLSLELVEDLPQILPRVLNMADDEAPYHVHVSYDETDTIQLRFSER